MRNEIRIELTNACQAKCIMCPREQMTRKVGFMKTELYQKIIDNAFDLGIKNVSLEHFGESFLDPHLKERILYAKSKGMYVMTITNGMLLKDNIETACLLDKLRISISGNEKNYEKIQLGLNYDSVVSGIRLLLDQNPRPFVELSCVELDENKNDINDWIERWGDKVDKISVWKPHNWISGRSYRSISGNNLKTCGRPKNGPIQVQWDGKVVPCTFDFNSTLVMGNLKDNSIESIMNNELFQNLIKDHESGNFPKTCLMCDQLQISENVCVYNTEKDIKVGHTNTFKTKLV